MALRRQQPQRQTEETAEKKARESQKMTEMRAILDEAVALQRSRELKQTRHWCLVNFRWYRRWLWFLTMQEVRFNLWWANLCYYFQRLRNPWKDHIYRACKPVEKLTGYRYPRLLCWRYRRWNDDYRLILVLVVAMWVIWFSWMGYLWLAIC